MGTQKRVGQRTVLHFILGCALVYLCAWIVSFGLLKQSQQDWGFLYDQQQSAINTAYKIADFPPSMFANQQAHPWPKEKVAVIGSGWPPDSASPWVWDLLRTRQQVIEGKESMMRSIEAQLLYSDAALSDLKQ